MVAVLAIREGGEDENTIQADSQSSKEDSTSVSGLLLVDRDEARILDRESLDGQPERERQDLSAPSTRRDVEADTGAGCDRCQFQVAAIKWFPAEVLPVVWAIDGCESGHGTHPDTYKLDAENGGRLQLNRQTWANFFLDNYGWTWEQVVNDLDTHLHAAAIVWERAGQIFAPWTCSSVVDCYIERG